MHQAPAWTPPKIWSGCAPGCPPESDPAYANTDAPTAMPGIAIHNTTAHAVLSDSKTQFLEIAQATVLPDRKSTRLNSSHVRISYAVFCLKKKNTKKYM